MRAHRCPICQNPFEYNQATFPQHFPFCSNRCQSIDLGHWFREDYWVRRPQNNDDSEDDAPSGESPQI